MNGVRNFLLPALLFLAGYACAQKANDSFVIDGSLDGLSDSYIYLKWQNGDSVYLDTANVKRHRFGFKGQVAEPVKATIFLKGKKERLTFFLENSNIRISGKIDSLNKANISGSHVQNEFESYQEYLNDILEKKKSNYEQYKKYSAEKDSATMLSLDKQLDDLIKEERKRTKLFIQNHSNSFISLFELKELAYSTPYSELEVFYSSLNKKIKNSNEGIRMAKLLHTMEKTSIGKVAMEFTQNDLDGNPIRLSDFRGKYVLLEFWASWCGPCRAENPTIVKEFNKYKNKGFTVLGVSLDSDSTRWKEAVEKDGLIWTQLGDLKGWENEVARQYGVLAIPDNYLIDPNGKIIGHKLRGEGLEIELLKIFN